MFKHINFSDGLSKGGTTTWTIIMKLLKSQKRSSMKLQVLYGSSGWTFQNA